MNLNNMEIVIKLIHNNMASVNKALSDRPVREDIDTETRGDKSNLTTPDTPHPAIEEWAYKNSEIESITIPAEITTIGEGAFACDTLREIKVSENNQDYLSIDGVLLKKCETMSYTGKHVLIAYPPAREGIEYTVPDSVAELCGGAFTWCNNLERINIPKDVSYIHESAIYACSSLRSIDVAEDNPCYISIDGVLYDKAMTTLLAYPAGKEDKQYKIPHGVRRIGKGAFASCARLRKLIVPDTVVSVGEWVFQDSPVCMRVQCDDESIVRKHYGENPTKSQKQMFREYHRKLAKMRANNINPA